MPITFLLPTSITDADNNIDLGTIADVDEGVANADGQRIDFAANSWSGANIVTFALGNLPAGALNINSVILRVRCHIARSDTNDTATFVWDVDNANINGSVQWVETDSTVFVNRQITTTGSPSVADVNGASIRVEQTTFNQSMGPDNISHRLDALELEVDWGGILPITGTCNIAFSSNASISADVPIAGTVSATFTPVSEIFNSLRFSLSASANIAASGEDTTFQLTAPATKSTGDFGAGRIQDDENPSDTITLTADQYTEVEFSIEANADAVDGGIYDFRITLDGVPLDTYTVTPQWTIAAAGGLTPITGSTSIVFTPTGDMDGSIGQVTGLSTSAFTPTSGLTGI